MKINRISFNTPFGGIDISLDHDKREHQMERSTTLEAIQGDILSQRGFDALVNPTNSKFLPGAHSLDRKVYAVAGEGLRRELDKIGSCSMGDAEVTQGYLLPYKYIIHVVGRKWTGNDKENVESLEQSYLCALERARQYKIRTIAFPSIGTGHNGFPLTKAAGIAVGTVESYLKKHPDSFDRIAWVLWDYGTYEVYHNLV